MMFLQKFCQSRPIALKTAKWAGAAFTLVLIATWVASGWLVYGRVRWGDPNYIRIGHGMAEWAKHERRGTDLENEYGRVYQWCRTESFALQLWPAEGERWILPLWAPAAIVLMPTLFVWRADLRARRGKNEACPRCLYSQAGLEAQATCPECGHRWT